MIWKWDYSSQRKSPFRQSRIQISAGGVLSMPERMPIYFLNCVYFFFIFQFLRNFESMKEFRYAVVNSKTMYVNVSCIEIAQFPAAE